MEYPSLAYGTFLSRPNRFVAQVELEGRRETVHVRNTGRCRELLLPGVPVCLVPAQNPNRKTAYDLVAVWKGERLINLDSQAPNEILGEYLPQSGLFGPDLHLRPEYSWEDSRFDFLAEAGGQRHLLEVKGVTLERDNVAYFPDAPTQRGVKHLQGLMRAKKAGYESWICFVIQMAGIIGFRPNDATHPAFGQALRAAQQAGVQIRAWGCKVLPGQVTIAYEVPVWL